MTNTTPKSSDQTSSSTGHIFSDVSWLDNHFTWMRPEYEGMLRWVGLKPGWRVLDAGSGPGSFLPLMTELVGSTGSIDAIDLAPENIAALEKRAIVEKWVAPVTARVGNVLALPYDDNTFDAAWCANTTQYLDDEQLRSCLAELRRVVRPGGLVAIKEADGATVQYHPTTPHFHQHFVDAVIRQRSPGIGMYFQQAQRTVDLPRWLRAAGLVEVRQKPTFMLRLQPLEPAGIAYIKDALSAIAPVAVTLDLPPEELAIWRRLTDFESPDHPLNHPDYQYRGVQTMFVGVVPA